MNPTAAQLAARLAPQPVDIKTPLAEGLFRGTTDYGQVVYRKNADGTYSSFDVNALAKAEMTKGMTPDQYGNYSGIPNGGGQAAYGQNYLKQTYGFDYNSLPAYLLADMPEFNGRAPGKFSNYSGDAASFFTNPLKATQAQTTTINSTANALATPEQIAQQQKNPLWNTASAPTAQTVESGIKNLGIPQTNLQPGMTGDAVKQLQDYLVANNYMTQAQVNTGYGTYGPQTTRAVADLQKAKGVNAGANAGYFGPQTRSALTQSTQAGIPSNISSDTLSGNNQKTDVASAFPKFEGDDAGAAVAGAKTQQQFIDEYIKMFEAPADTKLNSAQDILKELYNETGNVGADQAAAEQAQQVQEKKVALTAIKGKMAALEAQFNAYSLDQEGKPITMASIQGSIQAKRNAIAGEMLMLQAQASFLTDQYNDALSAANRAVDLKYQDIERKIRIQEALVGMYKDDKNAKDSLRSQAVTAYLAEQKAKVDEVKASQKELNTFAIDAMKSYRDAGIQLGDSYSTIQSKIQRSASYQTEQAKKADTVEFGGYSGTDVVNIKKDIEENGLDAVLSGISDPKEVKAIQDLAKGIEPIKLTREKISTLYNLPDDDGGEGWFGYGKTNKEKLNDIMAVIASYQAIGLSDADILKLLEKNRE